MPIKEDEEMKISVREMKESDIEQIVEYFTNATPEFLIGMGADPNKLPSKEKWIGILQGEFRKDNKEKDFYYIIWQIGEKSIGHSNINKIKFAKEAYMHLHLWRKENRQKGIGLKLIKETLPFYFRNFKLQELICEPYSLNPAANKTLVNLGFEFIKEYETTPGWINFHQKVNRYVMTKNRFEEKLKHNTTKPKLHSALGGHGKTGVYSKRYFSRSNKRRQRCCREYENSSCCCDEVIII